MKKYENALIYQLHNHSIHGATIDAFEYFFAVYEHNKNFKLILIDSNKQVAEKICSVIEDRYNLEGIENFRENIEFLKFHELVKTRFKKAFISSFHTTKRIKGLVFSEKIFITCGTMELGQKALFNRKLYDVTHFGEMPFDDRDVEYKIKVLFKRFKPLTFSNEGIYINSPRNDDTKFISELNLPKNKPIIWKSRSHLYNLFEHFDTYIYYHANKWFDPHPRLFLECKFYDKEIHYYNKFDIKDGSYYRYHDVIKNGLTGRYLDENDEIVRQLI